MDRRKLIRWLKEHWPRVLVWGSVVAGLFWAYLYLATEADKTITSENLGLIEQLARILTPPTILLGFYVAWRRSLAAEKQAETASRQVEVLERGQVTQRFTEAIKQLGDDKMSIRLGGIYALEQIAKDAPESYHWTVCEVLCSFLREQRPTKPADDQQQQAEQESKAPPLTIDFQAALTVLGRFRDRENERGYLDLARTNLSRADLTEADLSEANFRQADLTEADLTRADLTEANFTEAILRGVDLTEANLSLANLRADLTEADLAGADLNEADLGGADLSGAKLQYADLSGASLYGATLNEAVFYGSGLRRAALNEADLTEAALYGTDLNKAVLEGADLSGADFYASDLSGTDLNEADLNGADLSEAHNLTQAQINSALGNARTILPDHLTRPDHWLETDATPDED